MQSLHSLTINSAHTWQLRISGTQTHILFALPDSPRRGYWGCLDRTYSVDRLKAERQTTEGTIDGLIDYPYCEICLAHAHRLGIQPPQP